jgi:hypothetical protein
MIVMISPLLTAMFWAFPPVPWRTAFAIIGAVVVLIFARNWILKRAPDQVTVGHVIAFDSIAFIVVGFAFVIAAADKWPAACLCAGAALFGGGLIGFLFGLPASPSAPPANTTTAPPAGGDANAANPGSPSSTAQVQQNHNLLRQVTGWLSTLLAGATFARYQDLMGLFKNTANAIGNYVVTGGSAATLGGGIILYFGLLGFLCGVVLPVYFLQTLLGLIDGSGPTTGTGDSGGQNANPIAQAGQPPLAPMPVQQQPAPQPGQPQAPLPVPPPAPQVVQPVQPPVPPLVPPVPPQEPQVIQPQVPPVQVQEPEAIQPPVPQPEPPIQAPEPQPVQSLGGAENSAAATTDSSGTPPTQAQQDTQAAQGSGVIVP